MYDTRKAQVQAELHELNAKRDALVAELEDLDRLIDLRDDALTYITSQFANIKSLDTVLGDALGTILAEYDLDAPTAAVDDAPSVE